MAVDGGGFATLAPEQFVDRHVGQLALDIPQGDVDAGDGVVEHGAIAPVGVDHRRLEDILNAMNLFADQERLEVMFERGGDSLMALCKRSTAKAIQAGLRRFNLDDDE